MQSLPTTQGRNLQYAIIGRLKMGHETYGLDPDQIREIIAEELIGHVNESDVIYIPPNFIICVDNPVAQEGILFHPTMDTNHFQLQMLPWSKEHELAQLPWITVPPTEASKIHIDPLKILPIISKSKQYIGNAMGPQKLKDNFAAIIPRNYDLQAPDFSYLLITELRAFYKSKLRIFTSAKQTATEIRSIMRDFMSYPTEDIAQLRKQIQLQYDHTKPNAIQMQHVFIGQLTDILSAGGIHLPRVHELANSVLDCIDTPLNLEGFKSGPPTIEVPVPLTYADRLKTIYAAAVQKIYCTTPIIETVKREENRYETYITIDNFTRRYFGQHTRNAPAMEAAAIYYALKYLTNVQGYRIMDLNYPILQKLVADIDAWNARINVFQLFSQLTLQEIDRVYRNIASKCQPEKLSDLHINNLESITKITDMLVERLAQYYASAEDLCQILHTNKEIYDKVRIDIYSPTRSYYHWGRSTRPTTAST